MSKLSTEALSGFLGVCESAKYFDRDMLTGRRVFRCVDTSHSTLRDEFCHAVWTDDITRLWE